jgi:CRP-like cAMP-binding protein
MDELAALKQVPIFSTMDTAEIAGIRAIMDEATYAPDEVIVTAGDPGDAFYVVVQGHVQFTVEDASGNEIVVDEVGAGGFFGELALLTGAPRAARGKALDMVVTLALDRMEFFTFLQQHPTRPSACSPC